MESGFTFLTITGPDLGEANTKQMRAHVTRANFARRRARKAANGRNNIACNKATHEGNSVPELSGRLRLMKQPNMLRSTEEEAVAWPLYTVPSDRRCLAVQNLFRSFHPLLLTLASGKPMVVRERTWIQLNHAEPALLEASLALAALSRGSISPGCITDASVHRARAIRIINSRLDSPSTAVTDGVIGAVFTLAYCERLEQRDKEYQVHMGGFKRMIQLRKEQKSPSDTFSWFSDLLKSGPVQAKPSSSNTSLDLAHLFLLDNTRITLDIVAKDISSLRSILDSSLLHDMDDDLRISEIDQRVLMINERAVMLRGRQSYVDALSLAIQLFLHLTWDRFSVSPTELGQLGAHLRDALSEPDTRLCTSIEFTAWQLLVGCVATTGFQGGDWFRITLWRLSRVIGLKSWDQVMEILEKTFMPHSRVLKKFKSAWEEVMETYQKLE